MYLLRSSRYGGSRFYDLGYELNGLGRLAEQTAGVVSQLCGFDFAEELTLLKWRDVFPPRELLRQYKAWCPICLAEWKEIKDNVVYEPLLWSIKLIDVCTKHDLQLNTKCPSCKKIIPILSRQSRNGYCSYCGTWLGNMSIEQNWGVTEAQRNFSSNIEDLILTKLAVKAPINFIMSIIKSVGGLCAFCRIFSISKSSASAWVNGKCMPSLNTVLSICCSMQLNAYDALSNRHIESKTREYLPVKKLSKKKIYRVIDWISVEKELVEMICQNKTPISVREVARKSGYDKRLLYKHFPEMCKEISARHSAYVKEQKSERVSVGKQELTHTIQILKCSGIHPSRRRIESLLPSNISLREEIYKNLWKGME